MEERNFEWITNKQKSIKLRKGKAKKGHVAVFQCGRNLRRCQSIGWARSFL